MNNRSTRLSWIALVCFILFYPSVVLAQRQMERLGRGIITIKSSSTQVYVGWRLLGNDPEDIAFNLYRSANGATAVKVNSTPITATTNYLDTPGNLTTVAYTYSVKPVLNGVEVADTWANPLSGPVTLPAAAPTRQYIPIPLQPTPDDTDTVSFKIKFCWVGDLDGDGEYDYVVDRYNPTVDARQWLQAYKRDGTLLWQLNMGPNSVDHYNITPGSSSIGIGHGDNVTVYDLDGDGKAEVIVRTANGVIFPNGTTLTAPNDEVQYISILDGLTGLEKIQTSGTSIGLPARAKVPVPTTWANTGHMNGHMGIVYADGMKPSVFWQSSNRNPDSSFNDIATTWDYRNGALTQRWSWPFTGHTATAHQIRLADVDNDGKDEYLDIGLVLKADGSAQINPNNLTEVVHGDRFHVTDIDPDRPGLETFLIQQNNGTGLATVYQSADKSTTIKKWYAGGVVDVGRGVVADIDVNSKGCEFFSTQGNIYDSKGNALYTSRPFPPEAIWWDADLAREFVATVGSTAESPAISKFYSTDPANLGRLYTIYNETPPGVYQAYGGRPQFWGDLFGDWREEYLCVANDNSEMRIYTTKIVATNRLYTLMHNPQYRIQTTTKGYVQASYVDYYLGYGMTPPPPPPMVDAKLIWRGGTGTTAWRVGTTASWVNSGVNSTYADGDTVRFDISGNNTTTVALTGALQPGAFTVYSPKDYTFDGTSGSIAGTTKLVKAGSGVMTMTGSHAFTGKTTVWDGALYVNGDLQGSPITVWGGTWGGALAAGNTGGRIGGTGRFSQPILLRYRGAITPGAGMGNVGTVTLGAGLTAEDGSVLAFDLSDDPTGVTKPNDKIAITGNLVLPTTGKVAIVIKPLNTKLAAGTYKLLTYTGTLTGSVSNLAVTLPTGTPYTLTAGSGVINLTVPVTRAAANVVWRGSGATWDLATTQNWLRSSSPDIFVSGDTVAFDSTGVANPIATLTTALPVGGVTVSADTDYTLSGAGSISGTGGLTKSGAGTLTISTTNDYTGATTINGGVVAIANLNDGGAASSLGAASTAAANLVINGGTLRLTGSQTNTNRSLTIGAAGATFDVPVANSSIQISGVATGTGTLTKTGPGTLILASANTYSGSTVINGGTIYLAGSTPNVSGLGTGSTVTINSGTLTMSDVQASETAAWNMVVPTGATARLNADGRCTLTGSLTGAGNFTFWNSYVRTDLKGNWSAFTGQINGAGGDFRITNTNGYGNASVNFGSGVNAYYNITSSTVTIPFGELTGDATALLMGGPTSGRTVTYQVGGKNTDATFAGTIGQQSTGGSTAIQKTGTGRWTLTGTNTYTGTTAVNAGALVVNGSTATGNVTVLSGATLSGIGTVGGATTVQGRLAPGDTTGTLSFGSNLTLASAAQMDFTLGTLADQVDVTGNLALAGTLNITAGTGFGVGTYTLFTYSGTLTNSVTLGTKPAGYSYRIDTATAGQVLLVVSPLTFSDWQLLSFNSNTAPNALAAADPDGDGQNNFAEYTAGTNPNNAASYLRVTIAVASGGGFTATWSSVPGKIYTLEYATDPTSNWLTLATVNAAANPATTTSYTDSAASGTRRFYRVKIVTP